MVKVAVGFADLPVLSSLDASMCMTWSCRSGCPVASVVFVFSSSELITVTSFGFGTPRVLNKSHFVARSLFFWLPWFVASEVESKLQKLQRRAVGRRERDRETEILRQCMEAMLASEWFTVFNQRLQTQVSDLLNKNTVTFENWTVWVQHSVSIHFAWFSIRSP